MAARKRLTHNQKTRDKIQTSMLLQRLEKFIQNPADNEETALTPAQVTAALGLMKKTLPDLQAMEHSGGVEVGMSDELKAWLGH